MFTFDLSNVVGDVAWSPYCATEFAAVTAEGKVYVYDLNINRYDPLDLCSNRYVELMQDNNYVHLVNVEWVIC